jgi:hypothetical protein
MTEILVLTDAFVVGGKTLIQIAAAAAKEIVGTAKS